MTAVQWLIDNLEKYEDYAKISYRCLGEIEIALELEKQQIIDAAADHCYPTCELARVDAEKYYTSTYGSKGSDDHIVDTNEMVCKDENCKHCAEDIAQMQDDAAAYVEQYNHEEEIMRERAIDFGEWLLKECGEFTTISMEQLYEFYLKTIL